MSGAGVQSPAGGLWTQSAFGSAAAHARGDERVFGRGEVSVRFRTHPLRRAGLTSLSAIELLLLSAYCLLLTAFPSRVLPLDHPLRIHLTRPRGGRELLGFRCAQLPIVTFRL